jgi:RNA polymerase sigma-70 factor (ECF subfamily)
MHDGTTSLSLLQRARERNQDAWAKLVHLYGPLVDLWCRGWGARNDDIEDLRQEVFQAASHHLADFRRDRPGDSFRGWLWTIARRKFLDHCRRGARQPVAQGGSTAQQQLLDVPEEAAGDDPPDEVTRLHHRALDLIRSQFEEKTWEAFWRCAVKEQAPADVARDTGMSPAAVRKAKSRVLRRLKQELGDLLG